MAQINWHVVQVSIGAGLAEPIVGPSALLSVLTRADGYLAVAERPPAWTAVPKSRRAVPLTR